MPEHIGIIEEAGFKKKYQGEGTTFCMKVKGEGKAVNYYINREQDAPLREQAEKLIGKTVKVTYEQSGDYRNPQAIEEVSAPEPVSTSGEDDKWAKKQRIEQRGWIAKAIIESLAPNASSEILWSNELLDYADHWFNWVYELPQNPKPQVATKDKEAVMPPAQGPKSKPQLMEELTKTNKSLKWTAAQLRQKSLQLATENNWDNAENISQRGFIELDAQQLPYLIAIMQTEVAKAPKT